MRTSTERGSLESRDSAAAPATHFHAAGASSQYDELDSEMVVGELDPDADAAAAPSRPRYDQAVLRDDAQEIVNGALCRIACAR